MAVADIVFTIFHVLLDWLGVAIMLVFLYMLFRLVSGGKGIGDLFKGGGGDHRRGDDWNDRRRHSDHDDRGNHDDGGHGDSPDGGHGDSPDGGHGDGPTPEEQAAAQRAPGLDVQHPGLMRVQVTTRGGQPVSNAKVSITCADMPRLRRMTGRGTPEYPIIKSAATGRDGCWPHTQRGPNGEEAPGAFQIGSGYIKITVKSAKGNGTAYAVIYPVNPQQPTLQTIPVDVGSGQDQSHHRPTNLRIQDGPGADFSTLSGVIS